MNNKLRNIGIIAHVDAGKTTLTERILYYTGESHQTGDVHLGTAKMDFTEEERKHGITIFSAATSVYWQGHKLNIIDTPGHIDFNIEVKRALRVLDGAVVVFDGVAGVEPQSESNWHLADDYGVPRICFVNKMDRTGADFYRVVDMIEKRLGALPLMVQLPLGSEQDFYGMIDLVDMQAKVWSGSDKDTPVDTVPIPDKYLQAAAEYRRRLMETVVIRDESLWRDYTDGRAMDTDEQTARIQAVIREGTIAGDWVPVLCGTAFKNKGVQPLLDAVVAYLPHPGEVGKQLPAASAREKGAFVARAFKIMDDTHGGMTWLRVYRGEAKKGSTVFNAANGKKERISRIVEIHADKTVERQSCSAGDIVAVVGLKDTVTGDTLSDMAFPVVLESISAPEPVIGVAIEAASQHDQSALLKGLQKFVHEDPSLRLHTDEESGQWILSGQGELQLDMVIERLQSQFALVARTGQPQVAYRETITRKVRTEYVLSKQKGGPGQYAKVLVEIEPLARGEGFVFEQALSGISIPREFVPAVQKGIRHSAERGVLAGYPCVDFKAVLLDGDFHEKDSSTLAFEKAAYFAFRQAAAEAGPRVLEPVMAMRVLVPAEYLGNVIGDIIRRRGQIREQNSRGVLIELRATAPLSNLFGYIGDLRAMSSGRGQFTMSFEQYDFAPQHVVVETA